MKEKDFSELFAGMQEPQKSNNSQGVNAIQADIILPDNKLLREHEGKFFLFYSYINAGQPVTKYISRDMFTQLSGGNSGCPPLVKLVERGSNINLSFHHLWVEFPSGMIHWRIGELTDGNSFEMIRWKLYHQEPGIKNKGVGSQGSMNEQGLFEGSRRWIAALEEKGYKLLFPSDEVIGNQLYFLRSNSPEMLTGDFEIPNCMLAQEFDSSRLYLGGVIVEPKYDGIRHMLGKQNGKIIAATRKRKQTEFLTHIKEQGAILFQVLDELTDNTDLTSKYWFDGEMYRHGWTFQKTMSAVRRSVNQSSLAPEIVYMVYDIIDDGKINQLQRREFLSKLFNDPRVANLTNIKLTKYTYVGPENYEQIGNISDSYVNEKFEGGIVRNLDAMYVQKRSFNLLKVKQWKDAEAYIVGAEECTGTAKGCVKWILNTVKNGSGLEFKANPVGDGIGDDESRKRQWENHKMFLGTRVTYKYFETNESGVPRFAAVIAFNREDA